MKTDTRQNATSPQTDPFTDGLLEHTVRLGLQFGAVLVGAIMAFRIWDTAFLNFLAQAGTSNYILFAVLVWMAASLISRTSFVHQARAEDRFSLWKITHMLIIAGLLIPAVPGPSGERIGGMEFILLAILGR